MSSLVNVLDLIAQAEKATLPEYAVMQHEHCSMGGADGIEAIIGTLRAGLQAHYISEGAWSHHQLIEALLQLSGPADVYISSYAMCEDAVRMLSNAMSSGAIKRLYAAIDNRIETRTAGSLQLLRSIATECALLACHAKATVVMGGEWKLVVIGSANCTENKRVEVGIAMNSKAAADFHAGWITDKIRQHG